MVITHTPTNLRYVCSTINRPYRRAQYHINRMVVGDHQSSHRLSRDRRDYEWEVIDWAPEVLLADAERYWVMQLRTYAPHGLNVKLRPGSVEYYEEWLKLLGSRRKLRYGFSTSGPGPHPREVLQRYAGTACDEDQAT